MSSRTRLHLRTIISQAAMLKHFHPRLTSPHRQQSRSININFNLNLQHRVVVTSIPSPYLARKLGRINVRRIYSEEVVQLVQRHPRQGLAITLMHQAIKARKQMMEQQSPHLRSHMQVSLATNTIVDRTRITHQLLPAR